MSFLRCAQFIRLIVQYSGQKSNFWDQEIEFSLSEWYDIGTNLLERNEVENQI